MDSIQLIYIIISWKRCLQIQWCFEWNNTILHSNIELYGKWRLWYIVCVKQRAKSRKRALLHLEGHEYSMKVPAILLCLYYTVTVLQRYSGIITPVLTSSSSPPLPEPAASGHPAPPFITLHSKQYYYYEYPTLHTADT